MNFTGIFNDLNYMTFNEKEAIYKWMMESDKPIKLEFMDYVVRGMKNFLKSPFKSQ